MAAGILILLILGQLIRSVPTHELRDFGSFYASGQAASKGLNPYGVYALTYHVKSKIFEGDNPNLNPPISVLLFEIVSTLDVHTLFKALWFLSLFLYGLSLCLLISAYSKNVTGWHLLLAFAFPGVWDTLFLGQIYMPLLLTAVGAWILLERNHAILAGLLIGVLAAVKPNLIVWPALLFLAGHRRASLTAWGVFVLLSVVPLMVYGYRIYGQWFHLILTDDPSRAAFPTNTSLFGLVARSGMSWVGLPLSLTVLVLLAGWAWEKQPPAIETSAMAISASLLTAPLAWMHYALFFLPIFFFRPLTVAMKLGFGLLAFPLGLVIISESGPRWIVMTTGSAYNWAVLVIFAALAKHALETEGSSLMRMNARAKD